MKYWIIILGLFVASCQSLSDWQKPRPPDFRVMTGDTNLHNANGVFMWKGQKFNGYIIAQADKVLLEELPIIDQCRLVKRFLR